MKPVRMLAALAAVMALAGCVVVVNPPATLVVTNNYHQSITTLYVSPAYSTSWGDNWIAGAPLGFGESVTLNLYAGAYDLEAVAVDGFSWVQYNFQVLSGVSYSWTLGP